MADTDSGASAPFLNRLRSLMGAESAEPAEAPENAKAAEAVEHCELCAVAIESHHRHLVDLETRTLVCACRPCSLLFAAPGAARGRFRPVPERCLHAPRLRLTEEQWERLQIPVNIAFFFHNSGLGRAVAFYPSPAGATESLLALAVWNEVVESNPLLQAMEPDVEALLVYRRAAGFDCYLAPIDACYELVGRIRRRWKGFHGGEEAWQEIDGFFAALRERSVEAEPFAAVAETAAEAEAEGEAACPS